MHPFGAPLAPIHGRPCMQALEGYLLRVRGKPGLEFVLFRGTVRSGLTV